MNSEQKLFLAINIIGGILVLGSYYFGIRSGKGSDSLWGGTPVKVRTLYTVSMVLSAIGYFIFWWYIFSNLGSDTFSSLKIFGRYFFSILFILILGASSLWMPLTNLMISNPSSLVWVAIRVVLTVGGLASSAVFVALLTLTPRPTDNIYYGSLIGILWFTFHTGVLDALLWPYFWNS